MFDACSPPLKLCWYPIEADSGDPDDVKCVVNPQHCNFTVETLVNRAGHHTFMFRLQNEVDLMEEPVFFEAFEGIFE